MRTTLDIDVDILEPAKGGHVLARQTDKTAGAVQSDLVAEKTHALRLMTDSTSVLVSNP